jgi:hypothetical protein
MVTQYKYQPSVSSLENAFSVQTGLFRRENIAVAGRNVFLKG